MAKDLGRMAEDILWRIIGGEETHPTLFRMRDARQYLMDVADDNPQVAGCVLSVVPKGEQFEVVQLMTDKAGYPIKNGRDAYLGRQIMARDIDDSVRNFLKGETRRNMKLDTDND